MQYATSALDYDAKSLYEQLEGIEDPRQFYVNEQEQLNDWRKCMVEFAYLLSYTLNNYSLSDTGLKDGEEFKPLMKRLNRMLEIPQQTSEPKLTIRHRGLGLVHHHVDDDDEATQFDFVIACGDCVVDKPYIEYLVKNKIIDDPKLITKLDRAFQFFALAGIYTIEINLDDWGNHKEKLIKACLMIWARYVNELSKESPKKIVYNELNRPDPNLTILAKINRFKREDLQKIISKIHSHYMS